MKTNTCIFTLPAALLLLLAAPLARAATWYVATTGNDANPGTQALPFRTIGKGMASAQSGDLVLVGNGSYSGAGNEDLSFQGRNFTLRSQGGAANCVIPRSYGVSTFNFQSGETRAATLDGFSIQNGDSTTISINGSSPTIIRCVISNSRLPVVATAGAIYIGGGSTALVDSCTFNSNFAENGGAMEIVDASPTLRNCTFTGNIVIPNTVTFAASFGGAIKIRGSSSPTIANCNFQGNEAGSAGSPPDSYAGGFGGAIAVTGGSASITNCTFKNNSAATGGGGVFVDGGTVTLSQCVISTNSAYEDIGVDGGGLVLQSGAIGRVINCLFVGNQASSSGGAIVVEVSPGVITSLVLVNSTITGNQAPSAGGIHGGLSFYNNTLAATNNIIWNNPGGQIFGFNTAVVSYSDVQGGFGGTNNINADPLFVNAASGNCRLQAASPCINHGGADADLPPTDLDGAPRILGGAPDMGAYEFTGGMWFVDRSVGNDLNPGTPASPFATVTKAITVAVNGNNIYVRQGNYGTDTPRITKILRLFNWGDTGRARVGQP